MGGKLGSTNGCFFFFNGENGIVYPLIGQQLDVLLTTSFDYPDVLLTVVDG